MYPEWNDSLVQSTIERLKSEYPEEIERLRHANGGVTELGLKLFPDFRDVDAFSVTLSALHHIWQVTPEG